MEKIKLKETYAKLILIITFLGTTSIIIGTWIYGYHNIDLEWNTQIAIIIIGVLTGTIIMGVVNINTGKMSEIFMIIQWVITVIESFSVMDYYYENWFFGFLGIVITGFCIMGPSLIHTTRTEKESKNNSLDLTGTDYKSWERRKEYESGHGALQDLYDSMKDM
ncbi:MAG: hypothetical protein LBM77_01050 [Spirochaetaceae bacterium]|jgi:hypothetical protein|nr:hypothetical protein [Spirochaetaceae bacterium]